MTMQARQEQADQVRQWERDWRTDITTQVKDIAANTTQMGLIVREMQGDVKDLMQWKADVQKRKDDGIDKSPDQQRANLALIISAIGAALIVLTYVAPHWKP